MREFATPHLLAVKAGVDAAPALSDYYRRNAGHLQPWEPERPSGFHSEAAWRSRLEEFQQEDQAGRARRWLAFDKASHELIGVCNFTSIVQGHFRACFLGYSIDAAHAGRGLTTEWVGEAIAQLFTELDLHRVMANYMPENIASGRVLQKLGFEREGFAPAYLHIAGAWRGHVLTAKINPLHCA